MDGAPSRYIADPGTAPLHDLTEATKGSVPYFWVLFNEAPAYDEFVWAIHHATDEQLADFGGFAGLPSELIPFNYRIYDNFSGALGESSNARVGRYLSPVRG